MSKKKEWLPFEDVEETPEPVVQDEKTLEFIEKSKKIHDNKFDYTLSVFKNSDDKLIIICPIHGQFTQRAANHLRGTGCIKCSAFERVRHRKYTRDFFITTGNRVHNNYYDYSLSVIEHASSKPIIICPIHGEFKQKAINHLRGQGCTICKNNKAKEIRNAKYTSERFAEEGSKKHNNKYNYDKSNYINATTSLIITCPIHGDFQQKPSMHLSGRGCLKCGGTYQKNNKEWIELTKQVHGDKYDYSKTEYVDTSKKVLITCKTHGDFYQRPSDHIYGRGCLQCSKEMNRVYTDSQHFFKKSIEVHGDKYDYSKANYVGACKKVEIICKEHGSFFMMPITHYSAKQGCPKCGGKGLWDTQKIIDAAIETHGYKYDYSKTIFSGSKNKIKIGCKIHGFFSQNYINHINGEGCPKCSNKNKTTDEFILQAKIIHNNKYDYSKSVYERSNRKIFIICKKHGVFLQTPAGHLSGSGCSHCGESHGEKIIYSYVIKNNLQYEHQKVYNDCRNPKTNCLLKFDYFIKKYNLLIEFDGMQHYIPSIGKRSSNCIIGKRNLKDIQYRDKIKTNYCRSRHINLLRIPYWDKHRIAELIDRKIQKIKSKTPGSPTTQDT